MEIAVFVLFNITMHAVRSTCFPRMERCKVAINSLIHMYLESFAFAFAVLFFCFTTVVILC